MSLANESMQATNYNVHWQDANAHQGRARPVMTSWKHLQRAEIVEDIEWKEGRDDSAEHSRRRLFHRQISRHRPAEAMTIM